MVFSLGVSSAIISALQSSVSNLTDVKENRV